MMCYLHSTMGYMTISHKKLWLLLILAYSFMYVNI